MIYSVLQDHEKCWQMTGKWKMNGIEIELFKIGHNFRIDRMIPSGSSWLMGVRVKRIVGRAHSMIEKGKKVPIQKIHYMMGHTGKHLINPTTKFWASKQQGN